MRHIFPGAGRGAAVRRRPGAVGHDRPGARARLPRRRRRLGSDPGVRHGRRAGPVGAIGYLVVRPDEAPGHGRRILHSAEPRDRTRLLAGAALFGVGWGLVGLCPGPRSPGSCSANGRAGCSSRRCSPAWGCSAIFTRPPRPHTPIRRMTGCPTQAARHDIPSARSYRPTKLQRAGARLRSIINNRPDAEAPGQPNSDEIETEARRLGLDYVHIPVVAGQINEEQAAAFATRAPAARPILAFCRTGTRSTMLWALAQAGKRSPEETIKTAAAAGYDLSALTEASGKSDARMTARPDPLCARRLFGGAGRLHPRPRRRRRLDPRRAADGLSGRGAEARMSRSAPARSRSRPMPRSGCSTMRATAT